MKKTISIILLVFSLTILFTGCASKSKDSNVAENRTKVEDNEPKISVVKESLAEMKGSYSIVNKGDYFLFSCKTSDVYVTFLDWLNKNQYEIVTTEIEHFTDGNFWITYRTKTASK